LGFDGLNDTDEANFYNNGGDDPALDNYQYYLNRDGGVLERYLDFNNPDGNSPVQVTNTNRGSTTLPDVEDVDRDLTMNTVNSYYEYRIPIKPGTDINDRYVTDIRDGMATDTRIPDGSTVNYRWIQYKIPLNDFTEAVGGISDFRSMSFMRMYLTGFSSDVVLRFATLDLVRGDWRTYTRNLQDETVDTNPDDDGTIVDVNTVNILENETRIPIPYRLPPGVVREQLNNNNTIIQQNEQSLSMVVENLEPQDSRGVFKNLNIDLRQYKKLKMFMHGEEILEGDYLDGDLPLAGFLRIGTDFTDNFYQMELPLALTPHGNAPASEIWPEENELEVLLADLNKVKSYHINNPTANNLGDLRFFEVENGEVIEVAEFSPRSLGKLRIGIKGNPSLGSVRGMMVGVKNIDNLPARGEVWFNELRLAGLDNNGGWATIAAIDANMADFANVTATGTKSTSGFGAIDQMPNERAREDAIGYDVVTNVNLGQLLPKKWGIQLPFNYGISEQLVTPEFDPVYDDLKLDDLVDSAPTEAAAEEVKKQAEDYTKRTSINFIGVRKERGEEADANFYDIENFTFNYSYNETNHRDFEIADLRDQSVNTGFVYGHNFDPKPIAPLANKDSILRGKYWQWLKQINLNLLPANVAVNANIDRQFNQQRFRDVLEEGVDRLQLPALQQRNYLFNWQYALNFNLTKSLRVNFTGTNNNIIRNYFTDPNDPTSEIDKSLGIWDGFWDLGDPNRHSQQMQLNYEIPFAMIPALDFISGQYSYTSNFDWQRGGDALFDATGYRYNTVQNANTHNITGTLTMQKLYDMVGLKKRDGKTTARAATRPRTDKAGNNPKESDASKGKTSPVFNTLVDVLTMVKRVNVSYNESNGTALPGYTQSIGFIGTTRPSLGFVFGSQADVRYEAARNGWLTSFPDFNEQFVKRTNKQLNVTATANPIRDLTIDITADRQYSNSYQENFKVDYSQVEPYQQQLGNRFGNFSISTIMIGTAFKKSDEFNSAVFEEFKENRITIANRLVSDRGQDPGTLDADGFPQRYGKTQQEVLLPAFFAAYTGQNVDRVNLDAFREIPIPNWNIKYTGLMKNKWFRKKFKRFSLSHGYRSSYSINSFQTNLAKVQKDENGQTSSFEPETGDFIPDLLLNNVVLQDQFNPLVRMDFEMQNSVSVLAEMRMDRALSLSFDNNLLTEVSGKEYTLGLGYRIKDVTFVTNIGGNRTRLKGDLNLKGDVTLRNNLTLIRNLD
ncbi:MAG: cell surface protein SprA, partial [Flavobacteriaceae bacterium]